MGHKNNHEKDWQKVLEPFISDFFLFAEDNQGHITYEDFNAIIQDEGNNLDDIYKTNIEELKAQEIDEITQILKKFKITLVEDKADIKGNNDEDDEEDYAEEDEDDLDEKIRKYHRTEGLSAKKTPLQYYLGTISSFGLFDGKDEEIKVASQIVNNSMLLWHGLIACPVILKQILDIHHKITKSQENEGKERLEKYINAFLVADDSEEQGNESDEENNKNALTDKTKEEIVKRFERLKSDYKKLNNIYKNRETTDNWQEKFNLLQLDIVEYIENISFNPEIITSMYETMSNYRAKIRNTEVEYKYIFEEHALPIDKLYYFLNQNQINKDYWNNWIQENDEYCQSVSNALKQLKRIDDRMIQIEEELGGVSPYRFKNIYKKQIDFGYKAVRKYKQIMIESNLRLVSRIALKYKNRGAAIEDLIQEGNIGLMKGVDRYDHTKGFKVSTYVTWWIRQGITRFLAENAKEIRIPVNLIDLTKKIKAEIDRYEKEHGREPSNIYLSEKFNYPLEALDNLLEVSKQPHSLENDVSDDGETTYAELIEDTNYELPEDKIMKERMRDAIIKSMETHLKERERVVLQMRYGIGIEKDYTLEEVGKVLGVTKERVRQIQEKAKQKLKEKDGAFLSIYYEDNSQKSAPNKKKRGRKPKTEKTED